MLLLRVDCRVVVGTKVGVEVRVGSEVGAGVGTGIGVDVGAKGGCDKIFEITLDGGTVNELSCVVTAGGSEESFAPANGSASVWGIAGAGATGLVDAGETRVGKFENSAGEVESCAARMANGDTASDPACPTAVGDSEDFGLDAIATPELDVPLPLELSTRMAGSPPKFEVSTVEDRLVVEIGLAEVAGGSGWG